MTVLSRIALSPYALAAARHPLFAYETRRVKWGWSAHQLKRSSLKWFGLTVGLTLGAWAASVVVVLASNGLSGGNALETSAGFIFAVTSLALLSTALCDFASVRAALNSINSEMIAGRWDLLRLATFHQESLIAAKHAAAQVRAWRITAIVISLRIASLLLPALHVLLLALLERDADNVFSELMYRPASTLLTLLVFALVAVPYLIEPLWRMRAFTALGLTISAATQNAASAGLLAAGAIFAAWLLQLIVIMALSCGLSILTLPLSMFTFTSPQNPGDLALVSQLVGALSTLLFGLITAAAFYGYYLILQSWSLQRVRRRVF